MKLDPTVENGLRLASVTYRGPFNGNSSLDWVIETLNNSKFGDYIHIIPIDDELLIYGTSKTKERLEGKLRDLKKRFRDRLDYSMNPSSYNSSDNNPGIEAAIIGALKQPSDSTDTHSQENSASPTYIPSTKITDLLVQGFKEIETPNLDSIAQLYDQNMENFGLDSRSLSELVNLSNREINNDEEYTAAITRETTYKNMIDQITDIPKDKRSEKESKFLDEFSLEVSVAQEKQQELKEKYGKSREIVEDFRTLFNETIVHYQITNSETSDSNVEYYVISITTPIAFGDDNRQYTNLELSLLSHIQTEWSKLREEIKGDFKSVDNFGLIQYDFRIQKSNASIEEIIQTQEKLGNAIFNTQTEYVFSKLGIRVDIITETDTSHKPLEYNKAPVNSILPGPNVVETPKLLQTENYRHKTKPIPGEIMSEYTILAAEAREKGISITDEPRDIQNRIYNPEKVILFPVILLALDYGPNSREGIIRLVKDRVTDRYTFDNEQEMSLMDNALKILRDKQIIIKNENSYEINKSYRPN